MGEEHRDQLGKCSRVGRPHVLEIGVIRPERIDRLDERCAQLPAQDLFDLARGRGRDRLVRFDARERHHRFPDHANADPLERTWRAGACGVGGVRRWQHGGARDGRKDVARVVIAVDRVL